MLVPGQEPACLPPHLWDIPKKIPNIPSATCAHLLLTPSNPGTKLLSRAQPKLSHFTGIQVSLLEKIRSFIFIRSLVEDQWLHPAGKSLIIYLIPEPRAQGAFNTINLKYPAWYFQTPLTPHQFSWEASSAWTAGLESANGVLGQIFIILSTSLLSHTSFLPLLLKPDFQFPPAPIQQHPSLKVGLAFPISSSSPVSCAHQTHLSPSFLNSLSQPSCTLLLSRLSLIWHHIPQASSTLSLLCSMIFLPSIFWGGTCP